MKNKNWIWIILAILVILGLVFFFFFQNNQKSENSNSTEYNASRSSSNVSTNSSSKESNTTTASNNTIEIKQNATGVSPIEEEVANFSTKIYTKEQPRQNNVQITCSTLNDTIVENGSVFSFCQTVGQATSAKGYQEADIFDHNGEKKKGLGGGNCQVSTTLYNAVLKVPSLVVTERHEHSNKVPYIQSGKDAAVAYGSYDLKFKNDSGSRLKIKAETSGEAITIRLLKVS